MTNLSTQVKAMEEAVKGSTSQVKPMAKASIKCPMELSVSRIPSHLQVVMIVCITTELFITTTNSILSILSVLLI